MNINKKILAIYYSQSGQLGEIIHQFTAPLTIAGCMVDVVKVQPVQPYSFPWTGKRFFSVMPDCVLGQPTQLEPLGFKESKYDLIIIGYQPWFLSPSIPSNSLLQDAGFRELLRDTPVITISAARNMWLSAFERIRITLQKAGARHIGNIALYDKHANTISFVTIFYWMLTGKKDRFLNIFPPPGVAIKDIQQTRMFGELLLPCIANNDYTGLQQQLVSNGAVKIIYRLMLIESKAKYIFAAWAKFISKRQNKTAWLTVFKYYLFVALFVGAPILFILDAFFIRPFSTKRICEKKKHYLLLDI